MYIHHVVLVCSTRNFMQCDSPFIANEIIIEEKYFLSISQCRYRGSIDGLALPEKGELKIFKEILWVFRFMKILSEITKTRKSIWEPKLVNSLCKDQLVSRNVKVLSQVFTKVYSYTFFTFFLPNAINQTTIFLSVWFDN